MWKATEEQAYQFCKQQEIDWNESSQVIRQCSQCDHYVDVDCQSSEVEINGQIYFDVCDDCIEELKGVII